MYLEVLDCRHMD